MGWQKKELQATVIRERQAEAEQKARVETIPFHLVFNPLFDGGGMGKKSK